MDEIKGIARVKIHPGKLDEWKRLTEQAMEIVRTRDPGTLQYEVFFNDDGSEAIVFERYRDADAALAHFANIGHLMEPLMATATVTGEVLGTPNETMRAQLGDGEPKLFTPWMAAHDWAYGVNHLCDVRRRRPMADPIEGIIGDYRAFAAQQRDRLATRGIDITPYGLSHLAYRVPEWDQYVHVRGLIERHAVANRENVWNGRPISLIVLAEPLEVLDGKVVPLIELIPPVHQRVYKMGLEHLGVVVGDTFDAFVEAHKPVLTGQQFQGPNSTPDPVYILFEDFTHVKFYRLSLRASVELDVGPFDDGFHHVDDWVPQRLVTATGPNPLPR